MRAPPPHKGATRASVERTHRSSGSRYETRSSSKSASHPPCPARESWQGRRADERARTADLISSRVTIRVFLSGRLGLGRTHMVDPLVRGACSARWLIFFRPPVQPSDDLCLARIWNCYGQRVPLVLREMPRNSWRYSEQRGNPVGERAGRHAGTGTRRPDTRRPFIGRLLRYAGNDPHPIHRVPSLSTGSFKGVCRL